MRQTEMIRLYIRRKQRLRKLDRRRTARHQ